MADDTTTQTKVDDELTVPDSLAALPLKNGVLFPELTVPLLVNRPEHMKLIDEVLVKDRMLALVAQRDADIEKPSLVDLHRAGVAAYILKMMRLPEGQYQILIRTFKKITLTEAMQEDPYLIARVEALEDTAEPGKELNAMVLNVRNLFQKLVRVGNLPAELAMLAANIEGPYHWCILLHPTWTLALNERRKSSRQQMLKRFLSD